MHSAAHVLVEACVLNVPQATSAVAAGAHRVELCGPGDGGTTPSLALVQACVAAVRVPVHVMIRPHSDSFTMDAHWLDVMERDIALALQAGAHGIVCGVLTDQDDVHVDAMRRMVDAAHGAPVVFHRAFDQTQDADGALDVLCALGVSAVLTSGHAATARDGAKRLAELQARAGDTLTVMAGGRVRASDVREMLSIAPLRALHARGTDATVIAELVGALKG